MGGRSIIKTAESAEVAVEGNTENNINKRFIRCAVNWLIIWNFVVEKKKNTKLVNQFQADIYRLSSSSSSSGGTKKK